MGRGSAFNRLEKEFLISYCMRAMALKEKIRDIDIADILGRGKNNISILRRKLGFVYKKDQATGSFFVTYKEPLDKKYKVDIETINPDKAIASVYYNNARTESIKSGNDPDKLQVEDFLPDPLLGRQTYNDLKNNNIRVANSDDIVIEDEKIEGDYDDVENDKKDYFTADRFSEGDDNDCEDSSNLSTSKDVSIQGGSDKISGDFQEDRSETVSSYNKSGNIDKLFDSAEFINVKNALEQDEWLFFQERWLKYIDEYDNINSADEFDDLVGIITENIKRTRLMKKEIRENESYDKELSESNKREKNYKESLAASRKDRLNRKTDNSLNIATIIAGFEDDEMYVELVHLAEKELQQVTNWAKKNLDNPTTKDDFKKVDGNEPGIVVGIDFDDLRNVLQRD